MQRPAMSRIGALCAGCDRGRLKTGWYSGRSELAAGIDPRSFDYIKLGPYVAHLGGLDSASTNQRLYRVTDGEMKDITAELRNKDRMLLG